MERGDSPESEMGSRVITFKGGTDLDHVIQAEANAGEAQVVAVRSLIGCGLHRGRESGQELCVQGQAPMGAIPGHSRCQWRPCGCGDGGEWVNLDPFRRRKSTVLG